GRVRAVRAGEQEFEADAVVLAVAPPQLGRLLPPEAGVEGLSRFRTQPIVDVHLWYDADRLELGDGLDFAALVSSPVQWVFRKRPGYLCCSLSAAGELVGRPEPELVELCHRELAATLPALRGLPPLRGRATRDPQATFVPAPGLRRPGPRTGVRGLVLAGAWTDTGWPATMESAVRSGRQAAAAVLADLDTVAPAEPEVLTA
ncbi:MAG: FAD-dependent oxidoreductase, partial [Candidatus Dormiibacterota bacterium]